MPCSQPGESHEPVALFDLTSGGWRLSPELTQEQWIRCKDKIRGGNALEIPGARR